MSAPGAPEGGHAARSGAGDAPAAAHLRCATANVTTLRPGEHQQGIGLAARLQSLEMQFNEADLHLVGIQEGRFKESQRYDGVSYQIFAVAADDAGSFGVQLWLHRCLRPDVRAVLPHSTRLLEVEARLHLAQGMVQRLVAFSAHAPHLAAPHDAKAGFWDLLTTAVNAAAARSPNAKIVVLLDANARVGSVAGPGLGGAQPDEENSNGELFRAFLEATSLAAANTYFEAGATWCSTFGTEARIDYVCVQQADVPHVSGVRVCADIDISPADREDHRVVATVLRCDVHEGAPKQARPRKPNLCAVADPRKCDEFRDEIWTFQAPRDASIHEHVAALMGHVSAAALRVFGSAASRPKKPWITDGTWQALKRVPAARRHLHSANLACGHAQLQVLFLTWVTACRPTFAPRRGLAQLGWPTRARLVRAHAQWALLQRDAAAAFHGLRMLRAAVKPMLKEDRNDHLFRMAVKAQRTAELNDFRGSFGVVRALSAYKPRRLPAVLLEDGTLSRTEEERQERWARHFAGVFGAQMCDDLDQLKSAPTVLTTVHEFHPTLHQLAAAVRRLPNRKAVGPDSVPAEILKAGHDAFAVKLFDIVERMIASEVVPIQWRGGRIVDLFKGKGAAACCDDSRGLLIGDHAGKAVIDLLKAEIDPIYQRSVPPSQFGAVKGGGTDYPHHLVRAALDYARIAGLSACVVFVDLVKAFDRILRELIFGFPQGVIDHLAHLLSLGLSDAQARWVLEHIAEHGTVLQQWGIDPKVIALVAALHTGSWFTYAECRHVIAAARGGRQGCKLGSIVFNAGYTPPLLALAEEMKARGVTMRASSSDGAGDPFWSAALHAAPEGADEFLDVTFVDDEALVLLAPSPRALDAVMDIALAALAATFQRYMLAINWSRGKSEALLKYRGRHAVACWEARRQPCGKILIPLPVQAGHDFLIVVDRYKHLGGIVATSGSEVHEARARASSALAAYAPLASRIFGAACIAHGLKVLFASALVWSRLFFNSHTWTPSPAVLKVLNGPYMRLLRRLAGAMRFDATARSDLRVRLDLDMPSIDCVLIKRRLVYAARLLEAGPSALLALLRVEWRGARLPWTVQLHADFAALVERVPAAACALPCLADSVQQWPAWIRENPKHWRRLVGDVHFSQSVLDESAAHGEAPLGHACAMCPGPVRPAFPTSKALAQHMRIFHKVRAPMRAFAPSDGKCRACGVAFQTRLRLLAHLSDSRRPRCRNWHLAHAEPLSAEVISALDAEDKALRLAAQRAGLSHVIAVQPALASCGRVVGRTSTSAVQ